MEIKRDEIFQFVRWLNILMSVMNIYFFLMGGGFPYLSLGLLNIAVWSFTRKVKQK